MNEQVARDVVLIRAIETTDRKREVLTEDDRLYASRSARELAQWQAADSKSDVTADHFLQQRADLLIKRLSERSVPFKTFMRRGTGWRGITIGLPLIALLLGAGIDRIGDPHRVDLLSAPLLGIIGWNLLVYLFMALWLLLPKSANPTPSPWMQRLAVGKPALPRKLAAPLSAALLDFMAEWGRISRKLTAARVARTLHLAAAMFATGAVVSLLARGLLTQYVAGWESTFLNGAQVHAVLSVLFAPAEWLLGLQGFTVADIEALRFANVATAVTSDGGRRWVLLYAATLVLLVVLPRVLLAGVAHFQARRRAARVAIDLEQPYFRQLRTKMGGPAGVLRVLPYSFTIDEARDRGLVQVAAMLLGENASVMLRPSSAYGDEPDVVAAAGVALTAALFNLAATPENENHGAFIAHLKAATPQMTVLIDESSLAERLGVDAGGKARIGERIALWQQFCTHHRVVPVIVNLLDPAARPLEGAV